MIPCVDCCGVGRLSAPAGGLSEEPSEPGRECDTCRGEGHLAACSCCGTHYTLGAWYQLVRVGVQTVGPDEFGPEERYELRNCACGSTLAWPL